MAYVIFEELQNLAKRSQGKQERIEDVDVIRAFSVIEHLQITNVNDVLLSCVSLNLINTYVNRTHCWINFKNRTVDLAAIVYNKGISGVDVIFTEHKSLIYFIFGEKLQFSFGGIQKTEDLYLYTVQKPVVWDGIRKQKCAKSLFDAVWENNSITFVSKNKDADLRDIVNDDVNSYLTVEQEALDENIAEGGDNIDRASSQNPSRFSRIKKCVDSITIQVRANSGKHILIHDKMLNQLKNDNEYFEHIFKELMQLALASSYDSVSEYLKNQNAKRMSGTSKYIWKYRISKGDRLLYTLGKYIGGIRSEYADTIVLIGYSKHDEQGRTARNFKFNGPAENNLSEFIKASGTVAEDNTETEDADYVFITQPAFLNHHKLFSVDESQLMTADFNDTDAYLSDEQTEYIESFIYDPSPTLVLGGAGTGKTLIALHVISDFIVCNETQKAVYFTQSYELRKSAEKRFEIIAESKDNVSFEDVNEFALKILNRPLSDMAEVVTQGKFIKDFPSWIAKNARSSLRNQLVAIDWVSVWTEIRGIIKGQLGTDWNRFSPIQRTELGEKASVDYLIDNNWLRELPDDKRCLVPCGSVMELVNRLKKDPVDEIYKPLIKATLDYFSDVDCNCKDLGKATYCTLSEEDSTVALSKRELYWSIYQYYDAWLAAMNYFDENDLARMAIRELSASKKTVKYDCIAVDEVQDYTELQLFLLHNLSRDHMNILYVGDGNQNVNPTLFRVDHLKRLYDKSEFRVFTLHRDFRCPGNVVRLSNKLSDIRIKKIAKQHQEQEIALESVLEEGSVPYRLESNDKNLISLMSEMAKYPSSIILVPDGETKNYINELATKAAIDDLPLIHTIPEIKGMEYKYVLCYDIMGRYRDNWASIMSEEHIRKQTGERYFFNLLYVGMTRSQMYLGFMDTQTIPALENELELRQETAFDPVQLHFTEMQNRPEDWFNTAKSYEDVGNYEDARRMYLKADADKYIIHRCDSQIARVEHRYDDSFRFAFFSKNEDLLKDAALHISDKSSLYPVAMALFDKDLCRMNRYTATLNMPQYLEVYFSEFDENEQCYIRQRITNAFSESTDNQISKLKEFLENEQQ